jgi:hypothetical protein
MATKFSGFKLMRLDISNLDLGMILFFSMK